MNRVIVVGSPRVEGRSALLADALFNACIDECPEDGVSIVSVASTQVGPCTGCDACRTSLDEAPAGLEEGDPLSPHPAVAESDAALHQCVIADDMSEVRKHLDAADELIVVSPVYFASVPAQFKCLLDRLQPYYYSNVRTRVKRPLVLHVVGEGGDPHGFEPLIGTVRSAFAVAGFELELVLDWIGKIDAAGEIVADAEEYPIPPVGGFGALDLEAEGFEVVEEEAEPAAVRDGGSASASDAGEQSAVPQKRPRLSLSDEPQTAGPKARGGRANGGRPSGKKPKGQGPGAGRGSAAGKSKSSGRGGATHEASQRQGQRKGDRGGRGAARGGGRRG